MIKVHVKKDGNKNVTDTKGHKNRTNKAFYPRMPALPHRSVVHEMFLTTCFTRIHVYTCIYNRLVRIERWRIGKRCNSPSLSVCIAAMQQPPAKGGACNDIERGLFQAKSNRLLNLKKCPSVPSCKCCVMNWGKK